MDESGDIVRPGNEASVVLKCEKIQLVVVMGRRTYETIPHRNRPCLTGGAVFFRVGTQSLFGRQLRFDIRSCIPILTTNKIRYSDVVKELLLFIASD